MSAKPELAGQTVVVIGGSSGTNMANTSWVIGTFSDDI